MRTHRALQHIFYVVALFMGGTLAQCAFAQTNIAPNGTGYRWWRNTTAPSNGNRVAATGINDNNVNTDVSLSNGADDRTNAWEAGGVVWTTAQAPITSVEFINGTWTEVENGAFTANLRLQTSADGTVWTDTNWVATPAYAYDSETTEGVTYRFIGTAPLENCRGIRVVGQVRTENAISWFANIREVRVFTGSSRPTAPQNLRAFSRFAGMRLTWQLVTGAVSYNVYRATTSGGTGQLVGKVTGATFVDTGLVNGNIYFYTVRGRNSVGLGEASREIAAVPNQQNSIGAGIEGLADWSRSNVFADLMKQARVFGSPAQPWTGTIRVDANGWPREDFGVILGTWPGMRNVGGTYRVSFQCATIPTIGFPASAGRMQNVVRDSTTGTVTGDLIYPEGAEQLFMSFTGTQGGVRNLRVLRPGYTANDLFTRPILSHLSRFLTLRFMDFTNTNNNETREWSDRTLPGAPSYAATRGGVPWEVCIDLCNLLGKDAWINVPHQASENYVRQLATLFRDRLNPNLRVFVEYSNEVWNWGFQQAHWNRDQATAEVRAGNSPLNYDNINADGYWAARRIGKRIKEISDVFRAAYGTQAFLARVRPVLCTQVVWPELWLVEPLRFLQDNYGAPDRFLYAAAGAPYFSLGDDQNRENMTTDDVLAALTRSVDWWRNGRTLENNATVARYYNLRYMAYEGGPDTFGGGSISAKREASLDPRLRDLCVRYLQLWFSYGFDTFNWYVAGATSYDTPFGTWGLTNDMANQIAPKILAIDAVRQQEKIALTQGSVIPGSVNARRHAFREDNWASQPALALRNNDWRGPFRDYLIRVPQAGRYQLDLHSSTIVNGVQVQVILNNSDLGTLNIPNTGSMTTFRYTGRLSVDLPEGMNVIRIRLATTNGCDVNAIRITP
jgi:hypothetical protein